MRFILAMFPISRREAEHSSARVREVLADMSWSEMIKTTLITIAAMVIIPTLLLIVSVADQWA